MRPLPTTGPRADGKAPGWLARMVVVVTPLALLSLWAVLLAAKGPYWLGGNLDPDYAYLLNGLGILGGQVPGHLDHPGTPVQLLVAGVIGVVHLATGTGSTEADVLARPEIFLAATNAGLLVLFAGILIVAGMVTLRATRSVVAALAMEIVPGLSPTVVLHVASVKPEPLLAVLTVLVATIAIARVDPARPERRVRDAVLFGMLVGLAIASKVSAAPLAVLPLLLLRGRTSLLLFVGATLATAAAVTFPAWSALGDLGTFVTRIASHSGGYGLGKESVFDFREYADGLAQLAGTDGGLPLAVGIVGIAVAASLARMARAGRATSLDITRRTLIAALATLLAFYVVVARHAAAHYLLPGLVVAGLVAALSIHGVRALLPDDGRVRRPALVVMGALVVLTGVVLWRGTGREIARLDAQRKDQLEIARSVRSRPPGVPVVHYYRSSSIAYALHFGDIYARSRLAEKIDALHPGHVFYNRWNGKIETWRPGPHGPLTNRTVYVDPTWQFLCGTEDEPVLFQGSPVDGSPPILPGSGRAPIPLDVVQSVAVEAIYRPANCLRGEKAGRP